MADGLLYDPASRARPAVLCPGSAYNEWWFKRIGRCVHPESEQQTWTETHQAIARRSSWTERAREQACRRVGRDGHSCRGCP